MYEKKINLVLLAIFIIWSSSLFITPKLLPPGTVVGLDGHSTIIEYMDKWEKMPWYPRAVYLLGDFLCHQRKDRSFILNDNQMPVCARCTAIYIGFALAFFYTLFIPNKISHKEYLLYTLPEDWRKKTKKSFNLELLTMIIIGLFLLPVAVDGGIQLITAYESNNILRIITGLPVGWLGGILLGALVNTWGLKISGSSI